MGTFIGREIGRRYQLFHPGAFNDAPLARIVPRLGGDISKVNPLERPDIVDPDTATLYEIKPEGRELDAMKDASYYQNQLKNAGISVQLGPSDADGTMGSFDWQLYHVNYRSNFPGVITYSLSYRPLAVPFPAFGPVEEGSAGVLPLLEGVP